MGNEGGWTRVTDKDNELKFEDAMIQLEDIVGELEHGDVPLEKAIELFQQGMKLSQLCSQKLEEVERKIETIVIDADGLRKKPFGASIDANGGDVLE
jgi:exodeoxyribonuclease VII small subunit